MQRPPAGALILIKTTDRIAKKLPEDCQRVATSVAVSDADVAEAR